MKRTHHTDVTLQGHTEHTAGRATFKVRTKQRTRAVYHKQRGANQKSRTLGRSVPAREQADVRQAAQARRHEVHELYEAKSARKAERKAAREAARKRR